MNDTANIIYCLMCGVAGSLALVMGIDYLTTGEGLTPLLAFPIATFLFCSPFLALRVSR